MSTKIKELDISNNKLETLTKDTVEFLEKANELELLELHNNPWRCDCEVRHLLGLIKKKYKLINHFHNITCSDGSLMDKLDESELCSGRTHVLIMVSTFFALFGCLVAVLTALYYHYRLDIHIYLYSSKCKLLRGLVNDPDDIDEGKKYDAFLSFAKEDEPFVNEHLIPYLEKENYSLCLHYRDWIPGESIPNQILQSVQSSRRTIVVLSPSFLESVWGKAEFRTAHAEALKEGRSRVIVVIYKPVDQISDLDKDLKAYLRMNTYVRWDSQWFSQQLKFAMPHPPNEAEDIQCVLCCRQRISKQDSNSHEVLRNLHLQNGKVSLEMMDSMAEIQN